MRGAVSGSNAGILQKIQMEVTPEDVVVALRDREPMRSILSRTHL